MAMFRNKFQNFRPKLSLKEIEDIGIRKDESKIGLLISTVDQNHGLEREIAIRALINFGENAVMPLISFLKTKDENLRDIVIHVLGKIGDKRAVLPLIDILTTRRRNRKNTIEALGQLQDNRAMHPIIPFLGDTNNTVRQLAATALGELGNTDATEPLLHALNDTDSTTRQRAAEALDNLDWMPRDDIVYVSYLIAQQEWEQCVLLGSVAVDSLILKLSDKDDYIRQQAAKALGKLKDKRATVSLINMIKDQSLAIKVTSIAALGELGDTEALQPLTEALHNNDIEVRLVAAAALGKLGDPRAISKILESAKSKDWRERRAAVTALDSIGDRRVSEPLSSLAKDPALEVRRAARDALDNLARKANTREDRSVLLSRKRAGRSRRGTRIVWGEDERDIRDIAAFTLRFAGYECIPASNGEEVVELALRHLPDLILMDVRMPRMTGYEACRLLKSLDITKQIPVVFLSAKGQESEIQQGLDAGAEEYLLKPFAPDQLTYRIRSILAKFGK